MTSPGHGPPSRRTTSATRASHHLRKSGEAARIITALTVLREQVIGPILAGVRSPRLGRKPSSWTQVDRAYEKLRVDMLHLFADLGLAA